MLSDGREHHLNSVTCVKWTEFKWKLRNYGSAAWTLTAAHYRVQQEWRVFRPVRLESGWVDVDQVGQFSSNLIRLVYQFACSLQMLLITTGRLRIGLLLYINVCADPSLCAVYNMDVCSLPDYFISFYKTSKPVSCSAAPGSKNFNFSQKLYEIIVVQVCMMSWCRDRIDTNLTAKVLEQPVRKASPGAHWLIVSRLKNI